MGYLDLTGKFPYRSTRGHEYILVGYHFDANNIQATPLKNREAPSIKQGWEIINKKFSTAGVEPNTWVIDNEASQLLKDAMTQATLAYQLVPPYTHRANLAKRAIQTFKNHFKAVLASLDPDFPIS